MEKSLDDNIILPEIESNNVNAYQYSPLSLAYLGDSVLDLIVKAHFVVNVNKQTYKYHKDVTHIVNAVNQSAFVDSIMDELFEDELEIYKRGRNANAHSKAKNATRSEYRKATGLEALLGYLYLEKKMDRLKYFTDKMIENYIEKNS
ncbi:MAG: hypothetical protein IJ141_03685 [Lachnospiraceae bacterium]|nr:hypothetical protein [Lachnospiraceae bacterium]